jgi:hypothetical protein
MSTPRTRQNQVRMATLLHFVMVCFLAPLIGLAACIVWGVWNHGRFDAERIPLALLAAFGSLSFIWLFTLPLFAVSYLFFRALARRRIFSWALWLVSGATFGFLFSLLGRDGILSILFTIGAVVGALTGAILRLSWQREITRAA